jgi:microcystin-dependent protein
MKYILNYVVIIIVLAISIGMLYIIFQNKIKNLESNLKKNDILDAQHYEYLQKLVNTAVYKFNSFDPTKVVQPIGTVICFAGVNIPSNYMLCDGTKLLIAEYSDLFKVIGQTFNQSNTDSTLYFNLPDLRGQFVRGLDNNKGIDIGRVFGSIQNWSTGMSINRFTTDTQGNHTHSTDTQGNHTHTTDVQGNHTHTVGSAWNGSGNPNQKYGVTYQSDAGNYTTTAAGAHSHTTTTAGSHSHTTTTAGSHSHTINGGDIETRPNNIALNYIIKILI